MFHKLMKTYKAAPPKAREKYFPTFKEWSLEMRWSLAILLFAALSVLDGCGGSSQQFITAQSVLQRQATNPNKELQQQIMVQALHSQSSQVSYKDYQVGPEDLLTIDIFGHDKLNRELRVNGQGEITMPLVGMVKVAGLTPQQIEKRLMELYDANYLVNPQVTVAIKEVRHQRVAITGAVTNPGAYEIMGPRTLLEVLSMAGGISNRADAQAGDVIKVIRHQKALDQSRTAQDKPVQPFAPNTNTMVIDLRRLVSGQFPNLNVMIRNGDVVHVPFAGTAYVLGAVKQAGRIPVKDNLTVSQAVAMAGGIDPLLGSNDITVIRIDDDGKPINIETNINKILDRKNADVPIKDNDVVMVNFSAIKKQLYIIRTLLPIPNGGYSLGM